MIQLSIRTDFTDVYRALDKLPTEVGEKAAARAVNRTIEQARTQMVRGITSEYRVLSRDVRDKLRIRKATFKGGLIGVSAELRADGRRSVNLIRFGARQTPAGVSVAIRKGGGRKVITGGFIANKGRTVFERVAGTTMRSRGKYSGTKHAEQIRPLQTIYVPQMFNARRINQAVLEAIRDKFPGIFEREARYAIDQFNRRR